MINLKRQKTVSSSDFLSASYKKLYRERLCEINNLCIVTAELTEEGAESAELGVFSQKDEFKINVTLSGVEGHLSSFPKTNLIPFKIKQLHNTLIHQRLMYLNLIYICFKLYQSCYFHQN